MPPIHLLLRLLTYLLTDLLQDKPESRDANMVPQWKVQATTMRSKWNVPMNFAPWTGATTFVGQGVPRSKRALELIDLGFIDACKRSRTQIDATSAKASGSSGVLRDLVVDISQNPCRSPWSRPGGNAHTLCTSTQLYSYNLDRMLEADEYLLLQGYKESVNTDQLSSDAVRSMAGEGIALPCLASVLYCIHASKGFT